MSNIGLLTLQQVKDIHDLILDSEPGLVGDYGDGPLEGALGRIQAHIEYRSMCDVFEIAAMYAVALARGHTFSDAKKRTALVVALTYLDTQGIVIPRSAILEDAMVDVATGLLNADGFAELLYSLVPD
ncbi:type II toxin-antitoxin system death-on-curing family toxin [Parachitinimonas caeni]|uniref:Type II toxin-antitoxin system death-on-curing family toxin n=1 Tax=Parachitinimonas caeni TaxID=3031301 RepID=A0ABT7DRX9_9NEIS|nr:type II toxin-antitoxin system death-on-curing family toxin [Parachitinimonas caeni]MDK2122822.1 type II toxin-antitoxin system death-on-curing family toxin [Parachitinimonas caeni]